MGTTVEQLLLPLFAVPEPPPKRVVPVAVPRLKAEQRRYLTGPIIVFNGAWGDTLPAWLREVIPAARLRQVMAELAGEEPEGLASLEEVVAYLYTASLTVPLASEWARVYFWAAARVLPRYGVATAGEFTETALEMQPWGELHLPEYERRECLDRLRQDIRRAVVRQAERR